MQFQYYLQAAVFQMVVRSQVPLAEADLQAAVAQDLQAVLPQYVKLQQKKKYIN